MAKLNRDEILRGLVQTLVDGWGENAVRTTLDTLRTAPAQRSKRKRSARRGEDHVPGAEALVGETDLPPDRRKLLSDLAKRFDEGAAFPKLGDTRNFLRSHQKDATNIKSRAQAFKRMLPILSRMSPKGLEKLIARSHYSGPADLGDISDAIRGAGENLRGDPRNAEEVGRTKTDI